MVGKEPIPVIVKLSARVFAVVEVNLGEGVFQHWEGGPTGRFYPYRDGSLAFRGTYAEANTYIAENYPSRSEPKLESVARVGPYGV